MRTKIIAFVMIMLTMFITIAFTGCDEQPVRSDTDFGFSGFKEITVNEIVITEDIITEDILVETIITE